MHSKGQPERCHLTSCHSDRRQPEGALLNGAKLRGVKLRGAILDGADLFEAKPDRADLIGAGYLTEKQLDGTNGGDENRSSIPR